MPVTPDAILDNMLDEIVALCTRFDVCGTLPTTYTEATSTYSLGNVTVTAGAGGGDFGTYADGVGSGRRTTTVAQNGVSVGTTGTANYIALTDGTSTLLHVADADGQSVSSGGTMNIGAFDIQINDPT